MALEDGAIEAAGEADEEEPNGDLEAQRQIALTEKELCKEAGDSAGEANWLLQLTELYAQAEEYSSAYTAADEAKTLYERIDDHFGVTSALQATAQVHLWSNKPELAVMVAGQALFPAKKAADASQEAGLYIMISQGYMQIRTMENLDPASTESLHQARLALDAASRAADIAQTAQESPLMAYALCEYAQAAVAAKRITEATQAAGRAVYAYRTVGDRQGEAYALIAGAKACIAAGRLQKGWETAGEALLLFRELGDEEGQELAEAAIDAAETAEKPVETWLLERSEQMALMAKAGAAGPAAGAGALQATRGLERQEIMKMKTLVRETVVDIAGLDEIVDDSPLMNMGLTSQSAVLLRNSLAKKFPGPSLPFTMMFDFPSINSMTDYFVSREAPS